MKFKFHAGRSHPVATGTMRSKRSVHSDPQQAACIRITEQLKALAIQAIESQE